MTKFDWQSEVDKWEAAPLPEPPLRRRRLSRLLWLVPLAAATAVLLLWRAQVTVDATTARLAEEVTANFEIIEQAAAGGDVELSRSFLSGRDAAWTDAQLQLLAQGQPVDYALFGLTLLDTRPGTVDFDAGLNAAELKVSRLLRSADANEASVRLTQTLIFRRGSERWLWAPPEDVYWGGRITADYATINTSFNERDADLIRRLVDDLALLLPRLCTTEMGFDCTTPPPLTIIWDTDPASLFAVANAQALYEDRTIRLPTPSLIGLPEDEVSYQALFRGYASLAVAPLAADLSGWHCCAQRRAFEALLDIQRVHLGIGSPPALTDVYDVLAREGLLLHQVGDRAVNSDADPEQLWAVIVAFVLESDSTLKPAELQTALAETEGVAGWFNDTFGPQWPLEEWLLYVHDRTTFVTAEHAPLPSNALFAECTISRTRAILAYHPRSDEWSNLAGTFSTQARRAVTPVSGGMVVVEENINFGADGVWRGDLWSDGVRVAGFEAVIPPSAIASMSPDRRLLQTSLISGSAGNIYRLLDVDSCVDGECLVTPLDGPIAWSTDGRRSLITVLDDVEPTLLLADENGQNGQPLGAGFAPRWLDTATFVYFTLSGRAVQPEIEMRVAAVSGATRASITQSEMIALPETWPDALGRDEFFLSAIEVNRREPEQILITLVNRPRRTSYLFLYDWVHGTMTPTYNLPETFNVALFSPDGRYLSHYTAGTTFLLPRGLWHLNIVDIRDQSSRPLGPSQLPEWYASIWTADGRWLLRNWGGVVYMIDVSGEYQAALAPQQGSCERAAWLTDR